MRDWLIVGCFVVMLMAPCVVALVASKAGKRQKEESAPEAAPVVAKAAKAEEDSGNFVRQLKLESGEMQTVRVVWSKQFDSGEYPRAGGRILRARRRV